MTAFLATAALLALASAPGTHARVPDNRNIAGYITNDDYPAEALRNEEQGTVGIRLTVDAAGRVAACSVIESSGSASLDATSCRVMLERARFSPARDRRGRPTSDSVTTRIRWRIAPDTDPALDAALKAWVACMGEAARPLLARTPSNETVADRAIASCPAEEAAVLAIVARLPPGSGPTTSAEARAGIRAQLLGRIAALRGERAL